MRTYRIMEAHEDSAGCIRYWVFVETPRGYRSLRSNTTRRRAMLSVFKEVNDDDIVISLRGTDPVHEEFGSEYKTRVGQYFHTDLTT